jgi:DNA-binding transcriptional ArsR family regulator
MPATKPKRLAIDIAALAEQFHLASDPTRTHVLLVLGDGRRHVGAICVEIRCNLPALSYHLTLLRHADLIEVRRDGQRRAYELTAAGRELRGAIEVLGG